MIPLTLGAECEAGDPFVARLRLKPVDEPDRSDAVRIGDAGSEFAFAGPDGLFVVDSQGLDIDGDVVLIDPKRGAAERIIRANSTHNTLLVTERCDQLCVMCSQPPKKTHVDRFGFFREACLLAPDNAVIGISGGEPTLYKEELFGLVEATLDARPDLSFHILSNGQHFDEADIERLRNPRWQKVVWGIPLYAADAASHDRIVAKADAFERLHESFHALLLAGARIELRTVVMQETVAGLRELARHVVARLSFIESWSIMQLENIGFAKNRWADLYVDHSSDFAAIADALDWVGLHGVQARLFNFPLCTVPSNYRRLAPASISDWKRKYAPPCEGCSVRDDCSGFFEWHPDAGLATRVRPL